MRSLAAITAGLLLLPAAAEASWPGANGRVSLTQRVPLGEIRANRDIFAYPLSGEPAAERARLTFTANNEEQSSWSPDGQSIAFKALDDVWVVRWDGSGLRQLSNAPTGTNNTQPSWSADGRRIVFRSNRVLAPRNVADVWIMNADGSDQRPLIERAGDERYPSMSPDGTKVLFRGDTDEISGNGDEEIFVATIDGTGLAQLTDNAVEDSSPNWSPDGTRIALQVNVDNVNQEIFVMNADGSNPVRLTTNAVHDIGPAWSPDGSMIAFTRALTPTDPGDVWVMNADGSGQRPLTSTDVIEESPDWQPVPVGFAGAACGESVVSANVRCEKALRLAARWRDGKRTGRFTCTSRPHSFDQVVVECVKRPWCRPAKRFAFVHRQPTAAQRLSAPPARGTVELEELGADDALPRTEED